MSSVLMSVTSFGKDGRIVGRVDLAAPAYLDWLPIEVKSYWFLTRGYGEPKGINLLFVSQGEQLLITGNKPLKVMKYTELKETENGLESKVNDYIIRHKISRVPRNQ